jgi:ABC-type phosphate transport system substrate-binding protein
VTGGAGRIGSRVALLAVAGGILVWPVIGSAPSPAAAQTDPTTLVGEGGSAFQPVMTSLLIADTSNLAPLNPAYTNVKIDDAISDFAGSGPDTFDADYAVSERPLSTAEASLATSDGRTFAYVPFAATPVAIATLVPTAAWAATGSTSITSSDFCQQMPLTVTDLGDIYGLNQDNPLTTWGDSRLQCTASGGAADPLPVAGSKWANLDPTMENEDLMTLLDSDPTSKALFDYGLQEAVATNQGLTLDDTPSEHWPYAKNTIPGGDQPLIGKLLNVNTTTNAPDTIAANWQLGATLPISSVWTGAPLGVPWNIPEAAIQNAQGAFVAPSTASATAAQADATLASTSDPTTNNLVTFNASTTDAAAYNNFLMMEEYLVVPTNTLAANKATKLAQFIRFVLGSTGQKIIQSFGAAPATPAMVTAGLKVATQLSVLGLSSGGATTTTTTVGSSSTTSTTSSTGTTTAGDSASSSTGDSSSAGQSGALLADTGSNPIPLVGGGITMIVIAGLSRRRLLRHTVSRLRPISTTTARKASASVREDR